MPRALLWLPTTAFRLFPWPTRPGLRTVGRTGPDAPVLLTANFALTVVRVTRALRGLDAWLLVANSHGINVWCASAGGHPTTHDIISALKTTGVADKVAHRRVILPQLAATGVAADEVRERAGWQVIWGPVYAKDLPAFLQGDETARMRQVRFELRQRLEMAVMWAALLSLLALVTLLFWPAGLLPLPARGAPGAAHAGCSWSTTWPRCPTPSAASSAAPASSSAPPTPSPSPPPTVRACRPMPSAGTS